MFKIRIICSLLAILLVLSLFPPVFSENLDNEIYDINYVEQSLEDYEFTLDQYCCDKIEGWSRFDIGGYINDSDGNPFQGQITFDWVVVDQYNLFENYTSNHNLGWEYSNEDNYLLISLFPYSQYTEPIFTYYTFNITINLEGGNNYFFSFDFRRIKGYMNDWDFQGLYNDQVYGGQSYVLEGSFWNHDSILNYTNDQNDLFDFGVYYFGNEDYSMKNLTNIHELDIYYNNVSSFIRLTLSINYQDFDIENYFGFYHVELILKNTNMVWAFAYSRLELPIFIEISTNADLIFDDDEFYIYGNLTEKIGRPFDEMSISDFEILDLDNPEDQERNNLLKNQYLLDYFYDYDNGNYWVNFSINPEYEPVGGRFGLEFKIDLISFNNEEFWVPLYFEFEREVFSDNTSTESSSDDTSTESSNISSGSSISLPAGLPGFEMMIVLVAIIVLPILRSKTNFKSKL